MDDDADFSPAVSSPSPEREERVGDESEGSESDAAEGDSLTDAQREVLEGCLHALRHADDDSHTLAALLLITRLCPANQLDKPTLRRVFEAVGLNLPVRLLETAVRGSESSGLPPRELLSLGTALLAALSTDPDMASHPQLLTTIPVLLGILANGLVSEQQKRAECKQNQAGATGESLGGKVNAAEGSIPEAFPANLATSGKRAEVGNQRGEDGGLSAPVETSRSFKLDQAVAADCYVALMAVCALPKGPDQLLSRGAVPALCQAVERNQTFSHERGLVLLGCLLSDKTRDKAWSKHPADLLALLVRLSRDFCQYTDQTKLDMCSQLVRFLPPAGVAEGEELKAAIGRIWGALRPMIQAKLTPSQIGPVLVLSACLLDLYGWEMVGPPKLCCLLVNRACVEVRMGLEEPPGTILSPEVQQTLTGCYRIMEAAIEQACSLGLSPSAPSPQSSISSVSLQQSRQVLGVLEEAFSAVMYHLQQVNPSYYGDPFVFATFRCLCSWLAEETSCLKEQVTRLLPFLISYSRSHLQRESTEQGLAGWTATIFASEESESWAGKEALRYLLPALCHLSAEEGPRKVLLTLDTPALIVDFLSQSWTSLKGKSGVASVRDPSMETACSVLLNFTVTEPERVRNDPCFRSLEELLSEALPVLVHKPRLLVLAANYCTLGLMIGRLRSTQSVEAGQRRFFSTALQFLSSALDSGSGQVKVSQTWEESWDEAAELWRLGLQALGGCVRAQPWISALLREEGWLKHTLTMLGQCSALPEQHTQAALEEALCAVAEQCLLCKEEIRDMMRRSDKSVLSSMINLKRSVGVK